MNPILYCRCLQFTKYRLIHGSQHLLISLNIIQLITNSFSHAGAWGCIFEGLLQQKQQFQDLINKQEVHNVQKPHQMTSPEELFLIRGVLFLQAYRSLCLCFSEISSNFALLLDCSFFVSQPQVCSHSSLALFPGKIFYHPTSLKAYPIP